MKNFKIGSYLKELRNEKRFSTRDLTATSGLSFSFISAIENGRKKNPSIEQISSILKSIVENNHSEFNYHSEKIKELSNGEIDLGIYVDSATSIMDAVTNKKVSSYLTDSHTNNGNYYDFPINDLKHHLEDESNPTFYGRVPLDADDNEHVKSLIYNYLNTKYDILESQLNALYNTDTIDEDKYNKILDEIEIIKRYIK